VAAGIYISSPQTPQPKVLVGYVSDSHPSFQLNYPFPKLGPLNFVRIELSFRRSEEILAEIPKEKVTGDVALTMETSKMVVCVGDIHQFDVHKDETLGQFLQRASRKWNVNYMEYEIQDLNFQTYPDNTKFSEYDAKGGSHIVRLVKKQQSPFQVHHFPTLGGAQAPAPAQAPGGTLFGLGAQVPGTGLFGPGAQAPAPAQAPGTGLFGPGTQAPAQAPIFGHFGNFNLGNKT